MVMVDIENITKAAEKKERVKEEVKEEKKEEIKEGIKAEGKEEIRERVAEIKETRVVPEEKAEHLRRTWRFRIFLRLPPRVVDSRSCGACTPAPPCRERNRSSMWWWRKRRTP